MRMKNKRGMTAMMDAMIFIVVMGMAVAAVFAFSGGESATNDASTITDSLFSAKLRTCDLIDTDETVLVSIPDMIAFYVLTNEGDVMDYLADILDSLMQRPDSYLLMIDYGGRTVSVGSGKGGPISGSVKEFTVTYGGMITTDLRIY